MCAHRAKSSPHTLPSNTQTQSRVAVPSCATPTGPARTSRAVGSLVRTLVLLVLAWSLFVGVGAELAQAAQSDLPGSEDAAASAAAASAADATAAPAASVTELDSLLLGRHERLLLERDVRRVAVADPGVLRAEVLDSREILVTAVEPGVTSLLVWFESGEPLERIITVQRDLALLTEIIAAIDPSIDVEIAPGRDAVILRGVVADANVRDAAEAAASAYVSAGRGASDPLPLLGTGEDGELVASPAPEPRRRRRGATIVNLLRVSELPALLEERLADAIAPITGGAVEVRRIQVGAFPDDALDVFLLEGSVPDQVALTRVLFVASRAVLGANTGAGISGEVRALADEAGALTQVRNLFGAGNVGGGGGQGQGLQSVSSGALGGGGQQSARLSNRIGAQVGRAKVVEAAGGRILSTIRVEHLPLVQVDVRLYEVSRSKLRSWRNELNVGGASFDQFALSPAPESLALQGSPSFDEVTGAQVGGAQGVASDEVQGLLGFLNGTLSGRGQAVSGGFLIDNLFQVLIEEEVARSISNPSLTVLSGEIAQFQVGGQIPVPVAVTVGGGTDQVLNGVEFRDFGIDLAVRPLVEEHSSSRITLDVVPRISLPDLALTAAIGSATGQSSATTAFESRATRTNVRVFDGEALVIGGLTTARSQSAQSRSPFFGDVPVLGWLFRNEADDDEETELVLVVTPSVVQEPRPEAALWAFPSTADVLGRCLDRAQGAVENQRTREEVDTPASPRP